MGDFGGNPVLQILQRNQDRALQQKQLEQQQDQWQQELEFRKQQQEDAKEQQKLINDHAEKQFNLLQAQYEAQQATQNLQQAGTFQTTGITPTNSVVIPGLKPTGDQPLVLSDAENARVTFLNPTGTAQTVSVPPLAQSPIVQEQLRQEKEKENAEFLKQRAIEQRQAATDLIRGDTEYRRALDVAQLNADRNMAVERARIDGQKAVEAMRGANELAVARVRASPLGGYSDSPGFADMAYRGKIGAISMEDVNKNPAKKELTKFAFDNDFNFLPKAQTDKLQAIEQMTNLLPTIQRMVNTRYQHPVEIFNPFTEAGQQYAADTATVRAAAPQAAIAISGRGRFTNPELERFDEYFMPSKIPGAGSAQANLSKINDFTNILRLSLADSLKGATASQTKAVVDNLKSQGAYYLNFAGQQPDFGPPSPDNPSGITVHRQNAQGGFDIVSSQLKQP